MLRDRTRANLSIRCTYFCCQQLYLLCYLYRPLALNGIRIGEASNPGPKRPKVETSTLAVINPTAIFQKDGQFRELMENHAIHTFACAETTATSIVQTKVTKQFGKLGMRSVWSAPVPGEKESMDNHVIGVK